MVRVRDQALYCCADILRPDNLTPLKTPLALFILLQILDLGTTLIVLGMGGQESNPIVFHMMAADGVGGLLISKLVVMAMALAAVRMRKHRAISLANMVFVFVVAWNIAVIARLNAERSTRASVAIPSISHHR